MDATPKFKVISINGVGIDNIDIQAAADRGISVLVAMGANAVSVAEHAIALLPAAVKRALPIHIWGMLRRGTKPEINAIATFMLLFTLAAAGVGLYLRSRTQNKP